MKFINNISRQYFYLAVALITCLFAACSPDDPNAVLSPAPTSEMVQFTVTPSADNPNIINFTNQTHGTFKVMWDLGNGATAVGDNATGSYAVAGDYTVKLTVFTRGGYTSNTKTIHVDNTDVALLDREDYNFLTGGADNADGKTWVIEKDYAGHLGVGPIAATTPDWYSAAANEKAAEGLYDDEMTFNLNGFAYTYNNHGDTFANGANAAGIGGTKQGDDITLPYTPPTGMAWSIVEEDGKKYLDISKNGFIAYYTGASRYEILKLTENELYLKTTDAANAANAWWLRLVPKGYSRPVVAKPYKAEDIYDNFDEDGNITWKKEALTLEESYDNPAPVPIDTSAKVAMYVKQEGQPYEFANMFADFDYNFDLTQRHVFKIKVYMPSYNDFTTALGEDWANKNLLKQVSIKLQNSTAAQPFATQVEVKQQVDQLDRWVELTFDFGAADVINRKDLDRIVIQVGGEGNYIPGIFFLDDFRLEK